MSRDLPTVVISDLDSTVCNSEHRRNLVERALKTDDWDEYSLASINDTPIVGTIVALRLLYPHHRIHLCTGRSIIAETVTKRWLEFYKVPYDDLFMYNRNEWDEKPSNGLLKAVYIKKLRSKGYQPVFF